MSHFWISFLWLFSRSLFVGVFPQSDFWFLTPFFVSVLQCVAVCCSMLQCVAVCCSVLQSLVSLVFLATLFLAVCLRCLWNVHVKSEAVHIDLFTTLQHTATHYNSLQHTATHCNTLQRTAEQIWSTGFHTVFCLRCLYCVHVKRDLQKRPIHVKRDLQKRPIHDNGDPQHRHTKET